MSKPPIPSIKSCENYRNCQNEKNCQKLQTKENENFQKPPKLSNYLNDRNGKNFQNDKKLSKNTNCQNIKNLFIINGFKASVLYCAVLSSEKVFLLNIKLKMPDSCFHGTIINLDASFSIPIQFTIKTPL